MREQSTPNLQSGLLLAYEKQQADKTTKPA